MTVSFDAAAFRTGTHDRLHEWLGAHPDAAGGFRFAVWAPRARLVRVVGEASERGRTLRQSAEGVWRGRLPGAKEGATYHYEIESKRGPTVAKADPFARRLVSPTEPEAVLGNTEFTWHDQAWMRNRRRRQAAAAPISIYEVHLGSWRRGANGQHLGYREIGTQLARYAVEHRFTHIELLPVAEHPYYGSWGYQGTGYFAATTRYGTPQDLKVLIETLHRAGVGVILDWVPSHFATDSHALGRFDGLALFEHHGRRRGFHPDWQSFVFDYGRGEVRSFLLSNARFWLEEFHADGIRVDAVASMLYLDFSRKPGEWKPNRHGGNENLDAYEFLRTLNAMVKVEFPGALTIAEESSSWPGVTRPNHLGGVGFDLKWDMGWMHDTLHHLQREPADRARHHSRLTFRMTYAFSEQFTLALSHDEVVHEKASLVGKMPGTDPERFANLRLLYGYQWALPGKKLLFMGGEFSQWGEWDHEAELDWDLLRWKPHRGIQRWVTDLNTLLQAEPALHQRDFDPEGFSWIDADDRRRGVISFVRRGDAQARPIVFVANLSGRRHRRYRLGVPVSGRWQTLLNSDLDRYGGEHRRPGALATQPRKLQGYGQSLLLDVPPLTTLFLAPVLRRS